MIQCLLCNSTSVSNKYLVGEYKLLVCAKCGHVFVEDNGTTPQASNVYDEKYYKKQDESGGYVDYLQKVDMRLIGFQQRLSCIERLRPNKGVILDLGCAVGLFVKVAKESGWCVKGVDESTWAVEYGRVNYSLDLFQSEEIGETDYNCKIDVITLWDMIEHVLNPVKIMNNVVEWIKPGGLLCLNTINSASLGAKLAGEKWWHIAPPQHLQYFTKRSLNKLLNDFGFRILWTQDDGASLVVQKKARMFKIKSTQLFATGG